MGQVEFNFIPFATSATRTFSLDHDGKVYSSEKSSRDRIYIFCL